MNKVRSGSWLALLPLLLVVAGVALDARELMLGALTDDAFYYLKIAQSIVRGDGSSFDGLAATNGYHPLWMGVVVALCALAGQGTMAPVVALLIASAAVCSLALWVLYQTVQRQLAPGMGCLALALCLPTNALTAMTNGMETGLLLLAVFAWVWCLCRYRLLSFEGGARAQFASGLLLGAIFLARLDAAFLVLAAGALFLLSGLVQRIPLGRLLWRSCAQVAGVLVLALPYFVWNQLAFGALSPISGRVKSSFPELRPQLGLEGDLRAGLAIVVLGSCATLALLVLDRRRGIPTSGLLVRPLSILCAGSLLHFLYTFLYMDWGVYWWHFVLSGVVLILGGAQLAERLANLRPRLRPSLAFGLPILIAALGGFLQLSVVTNKAASHREWLRASEWALHETAPDSVFAMKDAGLFGYFSRRAVINLDGKANGHEFLDALRAGEVHGYLQAAGVDYLADIDGSHHDGHAMIRLPRVGQTAFRIWTLAEHEVYRGADYARRRLWLEDAYTTHFSIWEYHGEVAR